MWAVTAVGTGFVAVGGGPVATIWSSPDGQRWQQTEVAGAGKLYDVVAGPDLLVATGNFDGSGTREGLVVTSSDGGASWTVAAQGADFPPAPQTVLHEVASGPAGHVATGYGADDGALAGTPGVIADIVGWDDGHLAIEAGGAAITTADGESPVRIGQLPWIDPGRTS